MTCSDFLASFSEFYDAAPGAPERAEGEDHLKSCDSCRSYVDVVDRGVTILRSMPGPELSPNFNPRLEHRLMHVADGDFRQGESNSALPVVTVVGMAILLTAVAWLPRFVGGTPEVELAPIVVSEPPEDAPPFGTARPPFLLTDDNPSPLKVGDGLFDDANSALYQYSTLGAKDRNSRLLRRTGAN